jgi:transcription initiation factor IIE alpha subunit
MPRRRKGIQYTSLEAYRVLTKEALGERQKLVFKALEMMGRASDKELSFALGWPINTITPRRGELEEMGLIECTGEQLDSNTQRHEMTWSVV